MQNIYLYNTLSRQKELFKPIDEKEILIYSCGPTVYHYAHIGNLRAFVFADILNNTLKESGYNIKHQINITDVGHLVSDSDDGQDKMEKGAEREGKSVWDIAQMYTDAFYSDLKDLNINTNKFIFTRATDYIKQQIEMIKILEERGFTYNTSDGIYFDTSKFPKYSELAKLDIEGLEKGKRISDENNKKKNKTDFALWKFSPTPSLSLTKGEGRRQMEWESPWGIGFPGWHIECSAMIRAVLSDHIDIHTGGIDLLPVHHTNEIAQSECSMPDLTGALSEGEGENTNTVLSPSPFPKEREEMQNTKFVNYWMHVNFLNADKGKMSKSDGEFLRLNSLKEKNINPLSYKYLLLMTHYRKELKFSWDSLEAADNAYQKLLKQTVKIKSDLTGALSEGEEENANTVPLAPEGGINANTPDEGVASHGEAGEQSETEGVKNYLDKFISAMNDDLNTSVALATLWSIINDKKINADEKYILILKMDKYLGLGLDRI